MDVRLALSASVVLVLPGWSMIDDYFGCSNLLLNFLGCPTADPY